MNLLLVTALLGAASAVPLVDLEPRNVDLAAQYNLPRESVPIHYDLRLFFDPDNQEYFFGNATIRIMPIRQTNQIVLHAMHLAIDSVQIYNEREGRDIFNSTHQAADDTHFLTIRVNEMLQPFQIYVLHIDYVGQFATDMFGVYVSNYEETDGTAARLITSQLQPTFARRAFPCYDEPSLKAQFRTTIYAPEAYRVVRTNMDLAEEPTLENGWMKHQFNETLTMSTYLLAFLVSNFDYVENTAEPIYEVPFRVYSRNGTNDAAAFALDFGQKNMVALENYTEFPYAFPKLDKAAVPDFAAGAMENWGLVIYREVALLVREGVTTTATRQNIGRIICHENMHMWFGNEVSPYSWTYTWLNEGFANFFENFATDMVLPEWRMMDQYVIALQNVLQNDAVLSVNPMTFPVYTPSQVIGTFNAVAYQKSGSVIRMMQHFLTPEVFRQGLVIYLRDMSRQAAQPSDLFRNLQAALDASNHSIPFQVSTIMQRWTQQGGFPVVTVFRSSPTGNSLVLQQERYLTDRSLSSSDRWHVPVNVLLSTDPNFEDTKPDGWVSISNTATALDVPGLAEAEWYIVNKQQTGYYRVNYEVDNWRLLAQVLNSSLGTIHVLNRAQIVDDSFNLARNGRLSYSVPMQIALYLLREQDYIPWAAANAAFVYLDVVLSSTEIYHLYHRFVLELSRPLYEQLGFLASTTEEHVTAYHRNIILDLNCRYGNTACVNTSSELLQGVREGNNLNPDIQTVVYCNGLRGGDGDNFDFLWNMFTNTADSSVQTVLLNALGCTTNPEKRAFYLQQIIDENSPVREQDRHTIAVSVINSGHENMEVALDFLVENFHLVQGNVQGLSGTRNILTALSRRLTSEEHAQKINNLAETHQGILTAAEQAGIADILENIVASINWKDQSLASLETWLLNHYNSANSLTATVLILIPVLVTLFNL